MSVIFFDLLLDWDTAQKGAHCFVNKDVSKGPGSHSLTEFRAVQETLFVADRFHNVDSFPVWEKTAYSNGVLFHKRN